MSEPGLTRIKGLTGLLKSSNRVIGLILKIKVQTTNDIKYRMGKELEEE